MIEKIKTFFLVLITKSGKAYWKQGVHRHEILVKLFGEQDAELIDDKEPPFNTFARATISTRKNLWNPRRTDWTFALDCRIRPAWWMPDCEELCWQEWNKWRKTLKPTFEALKNALEKGRYENILKARVSRVISEKELELLKQWASRIRPANQIMEEIEDNVLRDFAINAVWSLVKDNFQGFMSNKKEWKSVQSFLWAFVVSIINGNWDSPASRLWQNGLIPAFNGRKWRLYSGQTMVSLWEGEI